MKTYSTMPIFRIWTAALQMFQAGLQTMFDVADDSASSRPGQNGRLFGYRPFPRSCR